MKKLFIFIFVSMLPISAHAINYCQFGQDPADKHFMAKYDGPTGWMPAESTVRMRGGNGVYYCKLKERQLVALDSNGQPHTFVTCGNPILDYAVPQQAAQRVAQTAPQPRTNTLLELARRPMGNVQVVDGTNPKARMTAEQFKLRFNLGASANWHFGLPDTNVQQNQNVSNRLNGGSGSSSKTIVRNGGNPKNPPKNPGGPVNPPQGPKDPGGGPVNPPQGPVNPPN